MKRGVQIYPGEPVLNETAWICADNTPIPIPDGLGNRWPVKVIAVGIYYCAVESGDHMRWVVPSRLLDCADRYDLFGNGSRAPESHPAALDWLEEELERCRQETLIPGLRDSLLSRISTLTWKLMRNGRQVKPAEDEDQRRMEEAYARSAVELHPSNPMGCFRPPKIEINYDDSPP